MSKNPIQEALRRLSERSNTSRKELPMDWRKTVQQLNDQLNNTYSNNVENVLDRMGYQPKRTNMDVILPAVSVFGAGLLVGAALGVLFAPKRGDELRGDLRHRLDNLRDRGEERYDELRAHRLENIDG